MKNFALVFRRTQYNRYSLPLLMGIVEQAAPVVDVFMIDSLDSLSDFYKVYDSIILAYSFTTVQLYRTASEVSFIKANYPKTRLIAGGPHVTADPDGCLEVGFDAVFVGEGERTLSSFALTLASGGDPFDRVVFADESSSPVSIDDYFPASLRHSLFGPMEITRGCFYGCSFCQTPRLFRRKIRHRSIESVLKGIKLAGNYIGERLYFLSPNAFSYQSSAPGKINYEAVEELLISVKAQGVRDLDIAYFPSEIRPESINERTLDLLKKYCSNRKIAIGIQSGAESVLKRVNRTNPLSKTIEAVELARKHGFTSHCDFIFGFPDETQEEADANIDLMTMLIKKYDARIHCHFFMPLPTTPLWNQRPSGLSEKTVTALKRLREWGKLDGWWEEQEKIAFDILSWKQNGLIKV